MNVRALLPSRRDYRQLPRTWRGDLLAGVTVGIVALPLALGFGVSSGLSAEAGLVTAVVAGLVAAVFGGSNVQVSGPTGAMVVVLVPIVAAHGAGGVAVVTILAGAILVVAGALRLGRAVSFIPWPVIEGFTVGIAVIIFAQQIPALVSAHTAPASEHSSNAIAAAVQSFADFDGAYFVWALGAVAVVAACMLGAPRLHRAIPGSLVGIVVVTVATLLLSTPLARIGALPSSLPAPAVPAIDPAVLGSLILPAATVAALAAIESLLSARVAASLAPTGPVDADRELVGQGLASLASSLFGGMPATGAIARTAVNVRSGGRSRLAAIIHALVLLLVVVAVAGPVGEIPLAALAGVLMVTAVRMVDVRTVRSVLRSTRADAVAFVTTAIVTVSVDLIVAVLIGVVLAGVFALRALSRASAVRREDIAGEPEPGDDHIAVLRFDGPLIFAGGDRILDEIAAMEDVSVVVLRLSKIDHVDATGARLLGDIVQSLERRGVTVLVKGMQTQHEDLFRAVGVLDALGGGDEEARVFDALPDAIAQARRLVRGETATA
ncbi:SulP family inorganic anion transporter [Microbacterium sp. bgisy203]|uniref:SulP family inorganic anion transporter n=1 Tax=Microbacterium sp. bgisy203 TaxID=3413799 RepID=UPI003D71C13E